MLYTILGIHNIQYTYSVYVGRARDSKIIFYFYFFNKQSFETYSYHYIPFYGRKLHLVRTLK